MPVVRYYKQTHFYGNVDWTRAETGWRVAGSNEPREIYELVGYDPICEAGESVEVNDPYMAVGASWPEDETLAYLGLPPWLEEMIERDERALAETTPVLASEKTLVGAV